MAPRTPQVTENARPATAHSINECALVSAFLNEHFSGVPGLARITPTEVAKTINR